MMHRLTCLATSIVVALTLPAGKGSSADTIPASGEQTVPEAEADGAGGGEAPQCAADEVDGSLNFYNWSEYIDPDLITEFEEQYDVDVVETFYDSNETMLAQI